MTGDNYYLLAALPGLGELGSVPPLSLPNLLERIGDEADSRMLLEALFLGDDLLQRQAFLSHEIDSVEPAVLTSAQATDQESLPEYLNVPPAPGATHSSLDALWEFYYRYVAELAKARKSEFLRKWVEYEVGLRNALVIARAKALNLDPQEYIVAPEIGAVKEDFSEAVNEWSAATDPFAGLRVLDEARWKWLSENEGWFTFEDDELVAYGAKLLLLQRWYRLSKEIPAQAENVPVK